MTSAAPSVASRAPRSHRRRRIITAAVIVVVLLGMALSTKVVGKGSTLGTGPTAFSAAAWGKKNFPKIQQAIDKRAIAATTLAPDVLADASAAGKKYGVDAGTGPEISTTFTGVVGKAAGDGIYPVTVDGLPKDLLIRIQTGPAINGTDLRDATGTVKFGQFTNQIDYQNAAAALNDQLKKTVLSKIDASALEGKTVTVTGPFQLINPKGWLITPSKLSVQ